jgi:hypothetical protein
LSGQAFGTDPEIVFTNQEIRLVLFATLFGIIGASIHGLGSLTAWISTDKLLAGWGKDRSKTASIHKTIRV